MTARWGGVPRQRQAPDRPGAGLGVEVAGPVPGSMVETEIQRWLPGPPVADDLPGSRAGHVDRVRNQVRAIVAAARAWMDQARDERPVTRADRARWAAASSLNELGELTADWLTGRIASQPGYYGGVDVDEADAPGLTAALVAANRAGYWTRSSQAGYDGPGYQGHWRQLAWVTGVIDPHQPGVHALIRSARLAGYRVVVWERVSPELVVTWWRGQPHTVESWMSPRVVRREVCAELGTAATRQVLHAVQVTVYDPQPGRNTMWAWLERAVAGLGGPA